MPQVIGLRVTDHRPNLPPSHSQTGRKIVVLATPTDKLFVEAVNCIEVFTRHSNVKTKQLGPMWIMPYLIAHVAHPPPPHAKSLTEGNLAAINAVLNIVDRQSLGRRLIEPKTVSRPDNARLPRSQMLLQVIRWKEAVAVRNQTIGTGTRSDTVVSTKRHTEPLVFVRG